MRCEREEEEGGGGGGDGRKTLLTPLFSSSLQAFQMLRELSVSMTGGQISSLSMQLPDSCRSKFSLPRDGVDSEEIIFDVKLDQGLQGNDLSPSTILQTQFLGLVLHGIYR